MMKWESFLKDYLLDSKIQRSLRKSQLSFNLSTKTVDIFLIVIFMFILSLLLRKAHHKQK